MKVLYSDQQFFDGLGEAVFLAGPTPRSTDVPSWRPKAIEILKKHDYSGTVLVPEHSDWISGFSYQNQIQWERVGLSLASSIVFWVPREMKTMPALTTNIEFGYYMAKTPEKCFYGRPDGAPHTGYLDWLFYNELKNATIHNSLEDVLLDAINNKRN